MSCSPQYMQYARQVLANSRQLVKSMQEFGYEFATGGTDNHMSLLKIDRSTGLDGVKMAHLFELVSISVNKNALVGDIDWTCPSGVRFGTPALTTRGMKESDIVVVAKFLDEAIRIAHKVEAMSKESQEDCGLAASTIQNFKVCCRDMAKELAPLRQKIIAFAIQFEMPGY
ncbi:hypothetical protein ACOME3_007270 [Neoechinorhynchus agilis]